MANDPASQAAAAQVRDRRYHADVWINVTLQSMMKLWKGIAPISSYVTDLSVPRAKERMRRYLRLG